MLGKMKSRVQVTYDRGNNHSSHILVPRVIGGILMAYHNKVNVSKDADNDLHYYRLMQA